MCTHQKKVYTCIYVNIYIYITTLKKYICSYYCRGLFFMEVQCCRCWCRCCRYLDGTTSCAGHNATCVVEMGSSCVFLFFLLFFVFFSFLLVFVLCVCVFCSSCLFFCVFLFYVLCFFALFGFFFWRDMLTRKHSMKSTVERKGKNTMHQLSASKTHMAHVWEA